MVVILLVFLFGLYGFCFWKMWKAKIEDEIETELEEKYGRSLRGY